MKQVLQRTSYMATMLTLHNSASMPILLQLMSAPADVGRLIPATNYSITLTILFVGGASGTPLITLATTEDGGVCVCVCVCNDVMVLCVCVCVCVQCPVLPWSP